MKAGDAFLKTLMMNVFGRIKENLKSFRGHHEYGGLFCVFGFSF